MCSFEKQDSGLALTAQPICTDQRSMASPHLQPSTDKHVSSNPAVNLEQDRRGLLFFFILGCAFSVFPIANAYLYHGENKDYSLWYVVGRSVTTDAPLYADVRNGEPEYMYPPTAAVLLYAPLSNLGPVAFATILCMINSISWAFAVWASMVIIAGKWVARPSFSSMAPGLAIASYVWDIQLLGQTNLLLLALTLGAFLAARYRHRFTAGGLFGVAVAVKVFPLPAIAYFVVRRQWMVVAASVFSVLVFAWLLPGIIRGFERNTAELKQWATLMIADQSGNTMAGRSSIGFTRRNQSLVSLSHRLLRHVDAGGNPSHPLYINFANVSPETAQLIGHGSCLLLGLLLLLACRFRFGESRESEGLEVAMVCTLVPLCSPLAWTYFFCWLLPGWTATFFWMSNPSLKSQTRKFAKISATISAILLASAVSEQFDPTLQAFGVTALGSVALFLTLSYIRFNAPRPMPV